VSSVYFDPAISVNQVHSHAVLLYFWSATDKAALANLEELSKLQEANPGTEVIAVHPPIPDRKPIEDLARERHFKMQMVFDLADGSGIRRTAQSFGLNGSPQLVLFEIRSPYPDWIVYALPESMDEAEKLVELVLKRGAS